MYWIFFFVLGHSVGFIGHSPREESPCADADTRMLSMYTSLPPSLRPLLLSFLSWRHNFYVQPLMGLILTEQSKAVLKFIAVIPASSLRSVGLHGCFTICDFHENCQMGQICFQAALDLCTVLHNCAPELLCHVVPLKASSAPQACHSFLNVIGAFLLLMSLTCPPQGNTAWLRACSGAHINNKRVNKH